MASQPWLSTATRQCRNAFSQFSPQTAASTSRRLLSTTSPTGAIRSATPSSPSSNPNSRLTALDDASNASNLNDGMNALKDWVAVSKSYTARGGNSSTRNMRSPTSSSHEDVAMAASSDLYVRQISRRWQRGDVYAPRDLSAVEQRRWRKMIPTDVDMVDALGFNPVDNYRNFSLISEYMSSAGRIQHSSRTGLRPVNQRKIAKAIRRAIGLGIHPSVHLHPQILTMKSRWFPNAVLPSTATPRGSMGGFRGF